MHVVALFLFAATHLAALYCLSLGSQEHDKVIVINFFLLFLVALYLLIQFARGIRLRKYPIPCLCLFHAALMVYIISCPGSESFNVHPGMEGFRGMILIYAYVMLIPFTFLVVAHAFPQSMDPAIQP